MLDRFLTTVVPFLALMLLPNSFVQAAGKGCGVTLANRAAFAPSSRPTYEEIINFTPAVHATDFLSEDGFLHIPSETTEAENINFLEPTRITLHFALGELVRPHPRPLKGTISWDKKKFAFVVPLRHLMPQALNIHTYDTFVVGNFKMVSEGTLIVPEGYKVPSRVASKVRYYKSSENLRDVVDEVIRTEKLWSFKMFDSYDGKFSSPTEAIAARAIDGNGQNVNSIKFFQEILKRHPYLSFGTAVDSARGNANLLGILGMNVGLTLMSLDRTIDSLKIIQKSVATLASRIREAYESAPIKIRQEIDGFLLGTSNFMNLVEADIYARATYNLSICGPDMVEHLVTFRNNRQALYMEIQKLIRQNDRRFVSGRIFDRLFKPLNQQMLAHYLSWMTLTEALQFVSDNKTLLPSDFDFNAFAVTFAELQQS